MQLRKEELKDLISEGFEPSELELKEKKLREMRRKFKLAAAEALELREKFEFMQSMVKPVVTKIVEPKKTKKGVASAASVIVASDWHVEELVEPSQVSGLNKYNPEIAKQRAEKFWRSCVRVTDVLSADMNIDTYVLGLLGDFISNNMREDSMENNAMLPMEAVLFAQDLIASGINYLLETSKRKIKIICHSGNHGRVTKFIHHGTENGNSLEWLMYMNLAKLFASESRVDFEIGNGYHTYFGIYDVMTRWHHGHNLSYGGGVGGITIPVNKAIAGWDKARTAAVDFFGHFHQWTDNPKFFCNGSLIGYNAYALSIKASYEPPMQGLHIIDSKRGRTYRAPIYVGE